MDKILNKLVELGMDKEEAKTFINEVKGLYVSKEDYDVLQGQMTVHEEKAKELSKTVKTLQKDVDASEALKLKLEDLQNSITAKDKEIEKVKFDFKLEAKMKEIGAKNAKAIKALINMDDVKLNEAGELEGFDTQIEALKESDAYLFEDVSKGSLGSSGNHKRDNGANVKNPFTKEHFNLTEQSRLFIENPTLAKQLQELANK